jgi:hypothetical protein
MFIVLPSSALLAGEIRGQVTYKQDVLPGVRVCLARSDAAPGECSKTQFTNKKGTYSFNGIDAGVPYIVKVLTDASLAARKADPYPEYGWEPANYEVQLVSRKDKISGIDFTGAFNFSNFQAELQLGGSDFPELTNYDLENDYVFLKVYTVDSSNTEQKLIFLGQVTDISKLLIEASLPLSATQLVYELYSATAPQPVVVSISLSGTG